MNQNDLLIFRIGQDIINISVIIESGDSELTK